MFRPRQVCRVLARLYFNFYLDKQEQEWTWRSCQNLCIVARLDSDQTCYKQKYSENEYNFFKIKIKTKIRLIWKRIQSTRLKKLFLECNCVLNLTQ